MRRLLTLLLAFLLASLSPWVVAQAQGVQRLSQLNVSLWPEYDRSAVLVIYQAELGADVSLPATVELPIPVQAGQPHAVAYQSPDGGLVNADYQTRQQGPWTIVSLQAESTTVWLEYYQDLTMEASSRSFSFLWPGTVAVDSLTFEVQEPVGSEQMQVEPTPTSTRTDGNGLTYQQGGFGAVESGQTVTVDVSYTKSDSSLTAEVIPPASQQGPSQEQGPLGSVTTGQAIGIALGTIAIVAIVVSGVLYFRRRRPSPKRSRRGRGRRSAEKPKASKALFCPQCGKPIQAGDQFCRHCGSRLPAR